MQTSQPKVVEKQMKAYKSLSQIIGIQNHVHFFTNYAMLSSFIFLLSSCCSSFWVSTDRIERERSSATVFLIDSECSKKSGYLVRIERDDHEKVERFHHFDKTCFDYSNDINRIDLTSFDGRTLYYKTIFDGFWKSQVLTCSPNVQEP
jgi:hypothetical protein